MHKLFLSILTVIFISFTSFAYASSTPQISDYSETRILSSVNSIAVDSDEILLGVEVKLKDGWKTYWRMPGDAGYPPEFDWSESKNLKSAKILYPAPNRYILQGLDNFGYSKRVIFPIIVKLENTGQALELNLKSNILVCEDLCIPQNSEHSLIINAGNGETSEYAADIQEFKDKLPKSGKNDDFAFGSFKIDNANQTLEIQAFMAVEPKNPDLFIENKEAFGFDKPSYKYNNKTQEAIFTLKSQTRLLNNETLSGLIKDQDILLTYKDDNIAYEAMVEEKIIITEGNSIPVSVSDEEETSILIIILTALIGGFILNLMPCVLPVLSLKILSVIGHGNSGLKEIRKGFFISALGIISSFLAIALFIIVLKSTGSTIGWGIQFQSPLFLNFLIIILVLFALNLFGLFEIPIPKIIAKTTNKTHEHEPTMIGHFMTGAFATLLATPCSAPFLGTAIGFGLSQGTPEILMIFTSLGIGMAIPYLAIAIFPKSATLLPKPGKWMNGLKKILAIALLITALWLIKVEIAILNPSNDISSSQTWIKFDEAKIDEYLKEDKIIFVDVTADWCITCKANKSLVLDTDEIEKLLSQENIIAMRADWTRPSDDIANYLKKYNRFGIPFNIVYKSGSAPIVLPELLTKDKVINAIKN